MRSTNRYLGILAFLVTILYPSTPNRGFKKILNNIIKIAKLRAVRHFFPLHTWLTFLSHHLGHAENIFSETEQLITLTYLDLYGSICHLDSKYEALASDWHCTDWVHQRNSVGLAACGSPQHTNEKSQDHSSCIELEHLVNCIILNESGGGWIIVRKREFSGLMGKKRRIQIWQLFLITKLTIIHDVMVREDENHFFMSNML